jgi:hypothetical protein
MWVIGADFSLGANLPFDKLRANEQAFPFALSLSKGSYHSQRATGRGERGDSLEHGQTERQVAYPTWLLHMADLLVIRRHGCAHGRVDALCAKPFHEPGHLQKFA